VTTAKEPTHKRVLSFLTQLVLYVMESSFRLKCVPASKFGAYGKNFSIAFVTFTTDVLEPFAALPSLTQFSTVFHLPASSNAFRL
jgi:hypothetical protein